MGKKFYIKRPANALEAEVDRLKNQVELLETVTTDLQSNTEDHPKKKRGKRTAVFSNTGSVEFESDFI